MQYISHPHQQDSTKQQCDICIDGNFKNLSSKLIFNRYYDKFNFYFAKPVNEILADCELPHVILFRDYKFYDGSLEYLKEYYQKPNIKQRIQLLEDFYLESGKYVKPNLIPHKQVTIIDKRYRKLHKLHHQNIHLQNQKNDQEAPQFILKSIQTQQRQSSKVSYDSSIHNVYESQDKNQLYKITSKKKIMPIFNFTKNTQWDIPLWASDNNDDLEICLTNTITQEKSRMKKIAQDSFINDNFPVQNFLKPSLQTQYLEPQQPIIQQLDLDPSGKNSRKKGSKPNLFLNLNKLQQVKIMQLMQSFSKSTNKDPLSKGFQTDRPSHQVNVKEENFFANLHSRQVPVKSVSPNQNKVQIQDQYKFGPKQLNSVSNSDRADFQAISQSFKKTGSIYVRSQRKSKQPSSKKIDTTKMKTSRHEQESEKLLKMLRQQNLSQPASPSRRMEIKLSLNRYYYAPKQQTTLKSTNHESHLDNSYGFWTSRNQKKSPQNPQIGQKQTKLNFRSIAAINFGNKVQNKVINKKKSSKG